MHNKSTRVTFKINFKLDCTKCVALAPVSSSLRAFRQHRYLFRYLTPKKVLNNKYNNKRLPEVRAEIRSHAHPAQKLSSLMYKKKLCQ